MKQHRDNLKSPTHKRVGKLLLAIGGCILAAGLILLAAAPMPAAVITLLISVAVNAAGAYLLIVHK